MDMISSWLQGLQNIDTSNGIWILAGSIIIGLVLLYIIFASVRTFFAWLYRIDTVIRTQHDTNNILLEILDTLENINEHIQKMDSKIEKNTKQIKKLSKKETTKKQHFDKTEPIKPTQKTEKRNEETDEE